MGSEGLGRSGEAHISAGDLERHDISLSHLDALDRGAHLVDDAAELVSQDIAIVHLHNGAYKVSAPFQLCYLQRPCPKLSRTMEEMQVTPADRRAGHLEDDVAVFDDFRSRDVNCESRPG